MEAAFVETGVPEQPVIARRRPGGMEHRFGRRLSCGTRVRLTAGEGIAGAGRLVNVSLSGAYIETSLDLPPFSLLEISSDGRPRAVELLASVVRKDATGVGVEWCETPSCSICRIFGCAQPCEVAEDGR
ncbi:MAG TPA: PilZ domain-containing protein [Steroidobacteraceae bacterium]|nr:PilZ domain-containing protein [Steroidobacteraceae bacterium]